MDCNTTYRPHAYDSAVEPVDLIGSEILLFVINVFN